MRRPLNLLLGLVLVPAWAGDAPASQDRIIVRVNGLVCSYCAYGVSKGLGKLPFADRTKFDAKGVYIDIHRHLVSLALKPGQGADLKTIHRVIREGGYDPVQYRMNLAGPVERQGARTLLRDGRMGATFELQGPGVEALPAGQTVQVRVEMDANQLTQAAGGAFQARLLGEEEL